MRFPHRISFGFLVLVLAFSHLTPAIAQANTAPIALNNWTGIWEDGSKESSILANDSDPDGDTLTVTGWEQPANLTVVLDPQFQRFVITPNANWHGYESFTYTISDGNGGTDTALQRVRVWSVNDVPVAANDSYVVDPSSTTTFEVLANDSDVEGSTLSVASVTAPSNGTVTNSGNAIEFSAPSSAQTVTFSYVASDGIKTNAATVTVVVDGDPPPPTGDAGPRAWTRTPETGSDVIVPAGASATTVANIVNGAATNATIRFRAGTYRLVSVVPKQGQKLIADPGVTLRGTKVLSGFTTSGTRWYIGGQTQGSSAPSPGSEWGYCADDSSTCLYPEDVFIDGVRQTRVAGISAVGAGEWYFDYGADRIYIGSNPAGKSVETSVAAWAFHGANDNVYIEGFTIERYATPGRQGAINPRVGRAGADGHNWEIVGNTIRDNHAVGIKAEEGMIATDNTVLRNGQAGMSGTADGIVIDYNEFSENCNGGYKCFGFEGGGIKLDVVNASISFNIVNDNFGHGIHPDNQSDNVTIEGNHVEDNEGAGLHYELSTNGTIINNTVIGSGEPGILLLNANTVTVSGNHVEDNHIGIIVRQDTRTSLGITGNLVITDNLIVLNAGQRSGIGELKAGPIGSVTWTNNDYEYVEVKSWLNNGVPVTEGTWKGLGRDVGGVFTPQ